MDRRFPILAPVLALVAMTGPQDPPATVLREYDVRDLVLKLVDRPAPALGLGDVITDGMLVEHVWDTAFPMELLVDLLSYSLPEFTDASSLVDRSHDRLSVRASEDGHKKLRAALDRFRSVNWELTVEALVIDLAPKILAEILEGTGDSSGLPEAKLARLRELLRGGPDAKLVHRFQIGLRPGQWCHGASVEEETYVRDVDTEQKGDAFALVSRTGTYSTGGTLELRASLFEQSIAFLDFRYGISAPEQAPETVEVAPDLRISLPSLRRLTLAGFIPVQVSRTAFAGSMPAPGKPGWDRAVFLRPQTESKPIHPEAIPDADLRLDLVDVRTLVARPMGYIDNRWNGEDAEAMRSKIMNRHPEDWDDSQGRLLACNSGFLMVRNDGPAMRRFAADLRDHVAARQSPIRLDFVLVSVAPEALGAAGGGDPLSPADAAKLFERAQAGEEAQLVWKGSGTATRSAALVLEDVVQRAIVESCRAGRDGLPDPAIGKIDWGVRLRASAGHDSAENLVRFHGCRLEFISVRDPIETAPAAAGAKVRTHLARRTVCRFERAPAVRPGAWVAVGVNPHHDRTLVLLARGNPGKLWK